MNEILIVMAGYLLSFVFGVGILWFFQASFFLTFLRVKASRGKLIIVKVRSPVHDYYRPGEVDSDGLLKFKDMDGETLHFNWTNKALYRTLNVNAVDVDLESGVLIGRDYELYNGYDPKKFSDKLKRALQKPGELKTEQRILFFLVIASAGLSGLALFILFGLQTDIALLIDRVPTLVGEVS